MLVWSKKISAKRLIAIDLEQRRLDEIREVTRNYSNIELVLKDGIEYFGKFSGEIDLLYLDFGPLIQRGQLCSVLIGIIIPDPIQD